MKLAIITATCIVLAGFIIIQLFPYQLISIFNKQDAELIQLGSYGLRVFLFMLPLLGFQIVSSSYFMAIGKPRQALFLSLLRQVMLLIPLVLILPIVWELKGIWFAGPVADLSASIITGVLLYNEIGRLTTESNKTFVMTEN